MKPLFILVSASLLLSALSLSADEPKKSGWGALGDVAKQVATEKAAETFGLPKELTAAAEPFLKSVSGDKKLMKTAQSVLSAFSKNNDGSALKSLSKLSGMGLTPAQQTLFTEFKDAASIFALQRNFDFSNAQLSGSLGSIASGLKTDNYLQVATGLTDLYAKAEAAKLTATQLGLLKSLQALYPKSGE